VVAESVHAQRPDADVESLRAQIAALKRENECLRERERCTREWVENPKVPLTARIIALEALWQTGAAPGDPAASSRTTAWTPTSCAAIGAKIGVSKSTVRRFWPVVINLLLVEERLRKEWRVSRDEPWIPLEDVAPVRGTEVQWRTVHEIAPQPGPVFLRTWMQPNCLSYDGSTPEHETEAREQSERIRRIRAQCPHCGSADVALVCHSCGVKTAAEDIPAAPATVRRKPPNPRGSNLEPRVKVTRFQLGTSAHTPLKAAASALLPAVHGNAVQMQVPKSADTPKYLDLHYPLVEKHIEAHLTGRATFGAAMCWPDEAMTTGRACRAVAYDSDGKGKLLDSALWKLHAAGLGAVISENPIDRTRKHLWVLVDAPMDATHALAVLEHLAPELAQIPEHFPNPRTKDGARLRVLGGTYLTKTGPAPVRLATVGPDGALVWHLGTDPAGWAAIAASVNSAAALMATWAPPGDRERLDRAKPQPRPHPPLRTARAATSIDEFKARHRLQDLVDINQRGYFRAPWRDERTASVRAYPDGRFFDYGPDKRSGDVFDLWCAVRGYWPAGAERPDYRAAAAALRPGAP
jgi:hypothetical protein